MAHNKNNVITRSYSGRFGNTCLQSNGVILALARDLPGKVTEKVLNFSFR
ncbi:MAG: hypothetical protein Q8M08_13455 [Bacteroidales bacterium]|nr:hypothetical protein [Bacteroidales bacterium]